MGVCETTSKTRSKPGLIVRTITSEFRTLQTIHPYKYNGKSFDQGKERERVLFDAMIITTN